MTDPVHPYKDKTKVDSYACELTVNGSRYDLTPLGQGDSPHPEFVRGFRLEKADPQKPGVYDVVQTRDGFDCDCPDFQRRRKGVDSLGCKHLRAMFHFGFLSREISRAPSVSTPGPDRVRHVTFPDL